jgi:hypothetical protein
MSLRKEDLYGLEQYSDMRNSYRARVMEHKKNRVVALGDNASLYFEDRLTIQYQVQEMLRIEKIFDAEGINEELETYNPLIPDGNNWKATFMIEFTDENERREALAAWLGIEKSVWMKVGNFDKVFAICNEDLERENEHKTSAVHFMRFQLSDDMVVGACAGQPISAGIDLAKYYCHTMPLPDNVQVALRADLKDCSGGI